MVAAALMPNKVIDPNAGVNAAWSMPSKMKTCYTR